MCRDARNPGAPRRRSMRCRVAPRGALSATRAMHGGALDGSGALRGRSRALHHDGPRDAGGCRRRCWRAWQEELDRNLLRMKHLARDGDEPQGARGRAHAAAGDLPHQQVAALAVRSPSARTAPRCSSCPISGSAGRTSSTCMPKGSFIEHMTQQGFDFYLVDWGVFGQEDNGLTVEDAVTKILPRLARKALESSGRLRDVGARLLHGRAAVGVASWPRIRSSRSRTTSTWRAPSTSPRSASSACGSIARYFDVDKYVDTLGTIPADMVKIGFKLLKPTMDLSTNLNLWWNLWNPEYVAGFNALNKWANEYLPFPGRVLPAVGEGLLPAEQARQGRARDGGPAGGPARASAARCSRSGAKEDNIAPPACVKPLIDAVSTATRSTWSCPGGHISLIAGRGASVHCWPKVAAWLAAALVEEDDVMADNTQSAALDMWKRQVEEGTQAWLRMLGQAAAGRATPIRRRSGGPFMDQGHGRVVEADDPGRPAVAGPDGAVEAVPRSVDRGVVPGARAGHGHRRLRPDHGQAARGLPQRVRRPSRRRPSSRSTQRSPALGLASRSQVIGAGPADRRSSRRRSTRSRTSWTRCCAGLDAARRTERA